MTPSHSPFRPGFGSSPPILAGRDSLIQEFADGLDDGSGSAERVSFYTGPRGIGKTVLLNALEEPAMERGWVIVTETCTQGLVARLTEHRLPSVYETIAESSVKRRTTGISVPAVGGITWENVKQGQPDLRSWIEQITDVLDARDSGLLLTVDEIHPSRMDELVEIASVLQHAIRENRPVAFAGSALSSSREGLLNGDSTTFLRRAVWHEVGKISQKEAARAIREPILNAGRFVTDEAIEAASAATQGHSFLIQLIGDLMWKNQPTNNLIELNDVQTAIPKANRRMGTSILAPEFNGLSEIDRTYLRCMALENNPRRTGKIAELMGVKPQYANIYRQRLIDAGIIQSLGYGIVDFVTPGMDAYVREHTFINEITTDSDAEV